MPKTMTIKKWISLSESTRRRALTAVFPSQHPLVEMMLDETPNPSHPLWKVALSRIKDADDSHYKTYIDKTYYM